MKPWKETKVPESSVSEFYVAFTFPSNMILKHHAGREEDAVSVLNRFHKWLLSGRRRPSSKFIVTKILRESVVLGPKGAAVVPVFSTVIDATTAIEAAVLCRKRKVDR